MDLRDIERVETELGLTIPNSLRAFLLASLLRGASKLFIACLWLLAVAAIDGSVVGGAQAQSVAPPEASSRSSSEREQIRAYLRVRLQIEIRMREGLKSLQDRYGDIKTDCPSLSELESPQSMASARTRMKSVAEMNAQLRAVFRERWVGLERAILSAQLPASIGAQVRSRHKETYSSVLTGIDRWEEGDEAFDARCKDVLSLVESNMHVLSEREDSRGRAELERKFQQLQAQVARAANERNTWNRMVVEADDGVTKLLGSAFDK